MPYKDIGDFQKPSDQNNSIWRYLTFPKYVSLISTKALWFTRVDTLDDRFEGCVTRPMWENAINEMRKRSEGQSDSVKQQIENMKARDISELYRKSTYVNCWHCNASESDAMWKVYGMKESIAIRSTFALLCKALSTERTRDVYIGLVQYADYRTGVINAKGNILRLFFYKRLPFRHESELRALHFDYKGATPKIGNEAPIGIPISVNIQDLIQEVVTSPEADDYFLDVVRSVTKAFGIDDALVRGSEIDDNY